jgi:hypothetical protein
VKRTNLLITLVLALILTSFAAAAYAQDPIITVTQDNDGPIACGEDVTFTVHYDPNGYLGELRAFSFQIENGLGDFLIFDDSDGYPHPSVTKLDWTGSIFGVDGTGPYQISVDGATLAGDPIPAETEADLFSITMQGDGTGTGELIFTGITLLENDGGGTNLYTGILGEFGSIEVDCTPPDAPVLNPEPTYTAGTTNTVSWAAVVDAEDYKVFCSNGTDSGWITDLEFTFSGLAHNTEYCYEVMARDLVGNESALSAQECSTQDAVTPESAVGPLDPAYGSLVIDVPWTASDDMSGVQYVQLYFSVDGAAFDTHGTTWTTSPIPFDLSSLGVGEYEVVFYTLATDNAGNAEADPMIDSVTTILDIEGPDAPVMELEDPFTPGTENTVSWSAVAGAAEYMVYCTNGTDSGWISGLSFPFTGLTDGVLYGYWVQARDALGNVSVDSAPVESTQDASAPWSDAIAPPSGFITMVPVDIDFTSGDATSGVVLVRLYYQYEGGAYAQYEDGFTASPISFTPPEGDGLYNFYTIAIDAVGNVEAAPPEEDIWLDIDTEGPTGTFVINNGDVYATSVDVLVQYEMADPNGIDTIEFKVNGVTVATVAYLDFQTEYPITLDLVQGEQEVCAVFTDNTGNFSELCDTIILDTIVPDPSLLVPGAGGIEAGHQSITLNWVEAEDPGDLAAVEIWCSLYDDVQDAVGASVYPEYDDMLIWPAPAGPGGGVFPEITDINTDADWFMLASVDVGTTTYMHTEEDWARGVYSYLIFAKDQAGNYSHANTQWPQRRCNYVLGDFDGDGVIAPYPDINDFAMAYGSDEVNDVANYDPIYDIGPLSGNIPATDNQIQFLDLMVLAGSYNNFAAGKAATGDPETPVLTWYPEGETTWVLGLLDPSNSVKGLNLRAVMPDGVTMEYGLGQQLEGNSGYFLGNADRQNMDLGFAVLGQNMVLGGTGEILRVTTSSPVDLSKVGLDVRNANNESMDYELKAEPLVVLPTAYRLENNYPNPFNPETNIKFSLPEAQDVKLEVFDIKGHRVRVLVNENMTAGHHSVMWNGRDKNGRMVASGTYFYRIQAGPLNQTHRMLLVK